MKSAPSAASHKKGVSHEQGSRCASQTSDGNEHWWKHNVISCGEMANAVTTFTDSDWAGCKESAKSSSAGVIHLGNHALKA